MTHTAESWCKLPLYLQWAGQHIRAVEEFEWLLEHLPSLARRWARLDDPSFGPAAQKQRYYNLIVKDYAITFREKLDLVKRRQAKADRSSMTNTP